MYSDSNIVHLISILEAIEKCFIYTEGFVDFYEFRWHNDQMNFNACVTLLIAIGEETKNIDEELKNEFPTINWKAIAGMRDKMAHNYRGIDPEITFDIIKESLPELKHTLIQLFSRVSFEDKMLLQALKSEHYKHIGYLLSLVK